MYLFPLCLRVINIPTAYNLCTYYYLGTYEYLFKLKFIVHPFNVFKHMSAGSTRFSLLNIFIITSWLLLKKSLLLLYKVVAEVVNMSLLF